MTLNKNRNLNKINGLKFSIANCIRWNTFINFKPVKALKSYIRIAMAIGKITKIK